MAKQVEPITLFLSFAHEDLTLCQELIKHLIPLQRDGLISTRYNHQIAAGSEWQQEIDK